MKIGRNDPCSCGSGNKYKKCCLNKIKIYTFKIILLGFDNFDCTIRLLGEETLCDLHYNLQDALVWDNDHMYSFFLDNKFWSRKMEYSANPLGEGNADICIKNLNLKRSQKIAYIFDYGDEHRFEIQVVNIELVDDPSKEKIGIVAQHGKAPEQYENYFEDEETELETPSPETL